MKTHEQSNSELPDGKILVVVAHPDDESVFHGNLIEKFSDRTHVVSATLGEAGTEKFVENGNRLKEFNDALDYWGVADDEEHRMNLKLPDGELHKPDNIRLFASELTNLAEGLGVSSLVAAGWKGVDGHSDHKATHIASVLAARKLGVQVWGLADRGEKVIPVDEKQKREAWLKHKSQVDKERINRIIDRSDSYRRLMQEKEIYASSNSIFDIGRAMFRLAVPPRHNVPEFK